MPAPGGPNGGGLRRLVIGTGFEYPHLKDDVIVIQDVGAIGGHLARRRTPRSARNPPTVFYEGKRAISRKRRRPAALLRINCGFQPER
jgi:hypothetical protein